MLQPRFIFLDYPICSEIYQSQIRAYINSFLENYYIVGLDEDLKFRQIVDKRKLESFSHTGFKHDFNGDCIIVDSGDIILITADKNEFRFKVDHKINKK